MENNILLAEFMEFEKTFVRNHKGVKYDYNIPNNFQLIKEVETTIESVWCEVLEEQDYCMIEDLKFNTDWNWLMQVVEKIESLDFIFSIHHEVVNIFNGECTSLTYYETFQGGNKIDIVYNACIEFIKWYNENK